MTNLANPPPRDKPKLRLCVRCGAAWIGPPAFVCAAYPNCRLPLHLRVAAALRWARDELAYFYGEEEDD